MAITLRDIRPEDDAFLLEVYANTRVNEMLLMPWTDEQKYAFVEMQFRAQHSHYREQFPDAAYKVILQDNEAVGRIYVLRDEDGIRIMDITVLPQYRNAGIGKTLIQQVMNEGSQSERAVRIYVEDFSPSLRLFERLGFSVISRDGFNLLLEWRPLHLNV